MKKRKKFENEKTNKQTNKLDGNRGSFVFLQNYSYTFILLFGSLILVVNVIINQRVYLYCVLELYYTKY